MPTDRDLFLEMMTWPEIEQRLERSRIALLPVGQTEQHGRHLPLDVDTRIAVGVARYVARETHDTAGPVISPAVPFGYSDLPAFGRYPGTFSLEPETLIRVYREVAGSLVKMGFSKIVFINAHCPNPPFISEAMRRLTKETGAFSALADFCQLADVQARKVLAEGGLPGVWGHACVIETSAALSLGADVREDEVKGHVPGPPPQPLVEWVTAPPTGISLPRFEMEEVMARMWPEGSPGSLGESDGYSVEIGNRIIAAVSQPVIRLVNDVASLEVRLRS